MLCNLAPIVLVSKLSPGTGCNYAVTQSCLVNHLPCLSRISLTYSTSCPKGRVRKRREGRTRRIFQRRTLGPLGHVCQLGWGDLCLRLHVLYFEVEGAGSSWPLEYTTSPLVPSPQASSSSTSLGTISSTLFLNQNVSCHAMRHFGSCHLDPVLLALGPRWRKSLSNL